MFLYVCEISRWCVYVQSHIYNINIYNQELFSSILDGDTIFIVLQRVCFIASHTPTDVFRFFHFINGTWITLRRVAREARIWGFSSVEYYIGLNWSLSTFNWLRGEVNDSGTICICISVQSRRFYTYLVP